MKYYPGLGVIGNFIANETNNFLIGLLSEWVFIILWGYFWIKGV
ncbi:MAG: hypothetical protein ACE5KT_00335 [Methanosarcinales archaeon]